MRQKHKEIHPLQRGQNEVALRALVGMGFADREARRALAILEQRRANSRPPPLQTLLREALSVLA